MRMRHVVLCGLSDSNTFFHISSEKARFSERSEQKMCFDFLYNVYLKYVSWEEFSELLS